MLRGSSVPRTLHALCNLGGEWGAFLFRGTCCTRDVLRREERERERVCVYVCARAYVVLSLLLEVGIEYLLLFFS